MTVCKAAESVWLVVGGRAVVTRVWLQVQLMNRGSVTKKNQSVSQSVYTVVKQIGAAPVFTRCGRATLTPVLEYLVTEPPLKGDGTPRYAAPAAKVMLSMDPRW
jgi:hypothetical protein